MKSAILLTLPILALCNDDTVSKHASEVVYTSDPSKVTSEYATAYGIETSTSAFLSGQQASTSIDADIFKRSDNQGNIRDIENVIGITTDHDRDLNHSKALMANHTYLGALSVFKDVARNLDLSNNKDYPDLFYFNNIWEPMWSLFKDHNQESHEEDMQKARDAAGILLLMVPTNYMIQTKEYEKVRTYVNARFNRSDHPNPDPNTKTPDKWKIVDTLKKDRPLNEDDTNFVRKLAKDDDASQSYVLHMLNLYYQYGKAHDVDAGNGEKDKRMAYGWGALKEDTDAASSRAIAETAMVWMSLFGLGIPLSAVYAALGNTAIVPLSPEYIEKEAKGKTYSTIRETTTVSSVSSTSSTTSTKATCQATYPIEPEYDDSSDDVEASLDAEASTVDLNKRGFPTATATSDSSPDIVARAKSGDLTVDTPKLGDYCNKAGNSEDVAKCNAILARHTVQLDPKTWSYENIPNNLDSAEFYRYANPGKDEPHLVSSRLPVYVVNALGQSPGVACNALKYIVTSYLVTQEFNGFKSYDDAKNGQNGMLTLVRGTRYTRKKVKRGRDCSSPKEYKDNGWISIDPGNTKNKGDKMEFDEFPPFSANLVVGNVTDIAVSCVPDYDNHRDGGALKKFYNANVSNGDIKDFWSKRCGNKSPSLVSYTDFSHYMPTVESSGQRPPLIKTKPEDEPSFLDNTAFLVVVNTKDTEGNDIQCQRYWNGNEFNFRTN